jgi:pSer/pThr/pTyr-binding forkhead associated (FHA) protein
MNENALELYRKACGLSAPLVLECAGPSAAISARGTFERPFVLVGRDPASDLFLNDPAVSRHHAFLQVIAGRLFVIDLKSRTKTRWEGVEEPTHRGWLDPDRSIQVGPYRIRRTAGDSGKSPNAELPGASAREDEEELEVSPMPRAALELPLRIGGVASRWPVEGPLVMVGRSEECELVLTDDSISRFHAVLVSTWAGLWVVDLLAREGVHVNGKRVRWAWLAGGDTLRMGRFSFVVNYEIAPDRINRQDIPIDAGASPVQPPGTALAVSKRASENGPLVRVPRARTQSPATLKPATWPPALEPDALGLSDGQVWEPAVGYPQSAMAMWQQQMQLMESFHNDMVLMVQMFVAMHREHVAAVGQELDKIQELTRELGALQAKMAQTPESANAGLEREPVGSAPGSSPDRPQPDKKPRIDRRAQQVPRTDATPAGRTGRPKPTEPQTPSAEGPAPPASNGTRAEESEQIHVLLTRRIAELQRERKGYWQRILSTINK